MDTWVWHQIGLELSQIDIQGSIESQGSSDGGDDLTNQTVQVGVSWAFNVQVTTADIVDGLIVNHESTVRVLKGGMGGQDGVVWLNNSSGDLRSRVDGKLQFGFLSVVNGETFHQEGSESRSSATTEGVEDQETLEASALVSQLTDAVKDKVNDFLSNGVVTTGVVVGSIFLSGDELFRVEQLTVGSSADLINNGWLQIDHDSTGDVLAGASLAEEGVEGVITASDGLVRGHLTIRLDAVLQAVQFPAGIAHLDTGLTDVDRDTFTHDEVLVFRRKMKKAKLNR